MDAAAFTPHAGLATRIRFDYSFSNPMTLRFLSASLIVFCVSVSLRAQAPALPKPPIVNDTALKIELLASYPDVEACTTVCGAPDGSFYVGNDPRDGRLNTNQPVNSIIRFGPAESGQKRKRTVFADKLYSPAGSAWHDGWLYVIHDPLFTRFKDTDGDGVADMREDLVTNLGIMPNEGLNDHVVSGFTLGMDGYFYISVGDRGIFQAKSTKDGSTISMQGGGIARCRTDGTRLEVFSTGTRNHLQVNLDAEDNAFTRDNTDDGNGWWTRLTHHIEGGYYGYPYDYRKAPNTGVILPSEQTFNAIKQHGGISMDHRFGEVSGKKEPLSPSFVRTIISEHRPFLFLTAMTDFGGGSPTGGLCYLSDGLPEQYRGKHFFSEWGKAGIFVTEVKRDGATFEFVSDTKLVEPDKGGDFRPMQISVAADGSILIADWGYGGWKSPRTAGAIWRLYWPAAEPAPRLDEGRSRNDDLVEALGHPDRDKRLRAQGVLVKRALNELKAFTPGRDWMQSPIIKQISAVMNDQAAPVPQRLHALWAWAALEREERAAVRARLRESERERGNSAKEMSFAFVSLSKDPDPIIRAQALRAVGETEIFPLLSYESIGDANADVRLKTAIAFAKRGELTVEYEKLLSDKDPWVRFAAYVALREHMAKGWAPVSNETRKTDVEIVASAFRSDNWMARKFTWGIFPSSLDARAIRADGDEKTCAEKLERLGTALVKLLDPLLRDNDPDIRARAATALGNIAYQPKPYDGHWWGTQPIKSPPPRATVAWSNTPQALSALITALTDAHTDVREAAAGAFTLFTLGGTEAAAKVLAAGGDLGRARSVASQIPAGEGGAKLQSAEQSAAAALRSRLTAETDTSVRRQLVESLGVQKDPQSMDVFRQIALDEKADAYFRETAIGAVVSIGGDAAKQTIAQLAAATLSPEATNTVITAIGTLKVLEAAPAVIAHLKDETAANREAAAKSLQQLGPKSNATAALVDTLSDKDGKVVAASIVALGSYRDKAALPALIALAEKKKSMNETMGALANMPDESAIPVLVETLRDKNTSVRRNAIKALKTMREKARPQVEALLASGRVPEELVPEIRNAFDSGAITKWKMVGVFENVWDAVHPPEKDVLAMRSVATESPTGNVQIHQVPGQLDALLKQHYHNAEGRDVGWIDVTADSDVGRVDLEKVFKSNAMVCAYAFTEIAADQVAEAKLFTSADDEIAVWLNGQRVLNAPGNHGYEPDRNETHLQLAGGKNQLFVKIGNKGGSWVFHARMPGFDNGKFTKPKDPLPDEKQRLFALAAKPDGSYANAGNAKNGEKLFFDQTAPLGGICATCHVVNGKGGQIGPDLSAIAANYKRPDLIMSIHEPSKTIALGFEQVVVETKGGETVAGALRQEAADSLTVMGADGQSHVVKKADVKTKTHVPTSLMPAGLTLGLKPEDFVDLIAYLETLKGK